MVVLAVLSVFAACLLIDWLTHRNMAPAPAAAPGLDTPERLQLEAPIYAAGFQLQPEMAYHQGHSWAYVEGPGRVRVGMDDFATRLTGPASGLELPQVGDEVVQGRPAWTIDVNGCRVPMLSPVSGQVVAVNRARTAGADPYREGWLCQIRPRALKDSMNNLLSGDLVRHWLEGAALRLHERLAGGVVPGLQDGGEPVDDLPHQIPSESYGPLVRELLLTEVDSTPVARG